MTELIGSERGPTSGAPVLLDVVTPSPDELDAGMGSTPEVARSQRFHLLAGAVAAKAWVGTIALRDATFRRALAAADVAAVTGALLLATAVSRAPHPSLLSLLTVPLIVVVGKVMGIYDRDASLVRKSTLDEAPTLFQLATLYALLVWLINGSMIRAASNRRELLVGWVALALLMVLFRAIARLGFRYVGPPERCLVVGDGPTCRRIRTKLASKRTLEVVGQVAIPGLAEEHESLEVLANRQDLGALASFHRVDRIIIAPEVADADEVLNVIRAATSLGVKVSVVPRLLEVVGSSVEFDEVEGVPLLSMRSMHLSRSSWLMKRALDVVVSSFGLILLSPVLACFALSIKLGSTGPVLFRQRRVGRDGEAFEMLKFRTMVQGAHEQREALRHLNEADGLFKIPGDPRLTRVGAWLRRMSLDELPQLWNVLRGDMSLVGPRPLVMEEDHRIEGWHRRRLQLKPGMTGHWQILGSARVPLSEMVNIDYLYVINWSLWADVKILLRTVPYIAARRGI